ncbi:MAG: MBL fold metallo-hydrolase [Chromatiales bacterium]|jgi:glyoxylase-like metal-dependent hydrolase (beta-lactamase superfamily II)
MRTLVAALMLAVQPLQDAWAYTPTAVPVADSVYALVGPTTGRTYENHALNNNLGFVVTGEGVVLIDSGASAAGARLIEAAVAEVTDQPVRWVINTGSQDHRWLGNGYFRDRGARIIALARTVETQRRFADQHLASLAPVLRERLDGTEPAYAEPPVEEDRAELDLGGVRLVLWWPGDAHFPGDAVIWLPDRQVLFSGDLIYVDRMLSIHPWTDVRSWEAAFREAGVLEPAVIVPGHGAVCDLDKARRDTGEYLAWLLDEVGAAVSEWEPLDATVDRLADAPAFSRLRHFESWHRSNLNRTYLRLEAE